MSENIQLIEVLFKDTKPVSQSAIEDYLKRTDWKKDSSGERWRHTVDYHRPSIYVNPENLGRCIETLHEAEKRHTGAIWQDIMEPQNERNN